MITPKQRLKHFIELSTTSINQFCNILELPEHWFKNAVSMSDKDLQKINKHYPHLNMHWVISGSGPMILLENMTGKSILSEQLGISEKVIEQIDTYFEIKFSQKTNRLMQEIDRKIFNALQDPIPHMGYPEKEKDKGPNIYILKTPSKMNDGQFDDEAPF